MHLDGCLRPETMIDLAREQTVQLEATTPDDLAAQMLVANAASLEEYLERFDVTLSVMQTPAALERVAYEFVVDSAAENVRYVEVRYCPALHTPAMSLVEAIESPLAGLHRGEAETGTLARLIVCGLRTLNPSVSEDLARAAVDYADAGVVAFDLAGAERGHPASDHRRAFEFALEHGLACTCHAGEGDGADSIREAIHVCGAHRIGHGTRLHEDAELEAELIERGVPLEMCLTSNLHTHTVTDVSAHPARRYFEAGAVVTLNTDSRLMDSTTLTDELWLAHTALGFTRQELEQLVVNGVRSAFLPETEKAALVTAMQDELEKVP